MGLLRNFGLRLVVGSHRRDLCEFMERLRGLDDGQIAGYVALAADVRNQTPVLNAVLLDFYQLGTEEWGMLPYRISRKIKGLQAGDHLPFAGAWMIWLHTARAAQHHELRYMAKQMWAELERGFPHVAEAARAIFALSDEIIDLSRATEFPNGLNPHI